VLDGKSDSGGKVFAYLERHGMSREEAVTPRKLREDLGGDTQELVLAFFDTEDAADEAATALRGWEKASEYMQVDAIGGLVKDDDGQVKEHKLGRRVAQLPRVTQEPRPPTLDQVRPPNVRHAAGANADDMHGIHPLRVMRGAGAWRRVWG
jgi:hypothetical protein